LKPGQLSENTASSLGRSLQVLLKNKFSESYLNRILRLIINNRFTRIYRKGILFKDTVVCTYHVDFSSLPEIKEFLEFKNALDEKLKGKSYLIILKIDPVLSTGKNIENTIEPETLFRVMEFLVACIKNGAQILAFDKPVNDNNDGYEGISREIRLQNLIAEVIREINPTTLIIPELKPIKNDQRLLAELDRFLQRSN
jgi:hypothetical protein